MSFWPREENVVAIDVGSYSFKYGRAYHLDELPKQIPSIVGRRRKLKREDTPDGMDDDSVAGDHTVPRAGEFDILVGQELTDALKRSNPDKPVVSSVMEDGHVRDWAGVEAILRHIVVTQLKCKPTRNEYPMVVSTPAYWSLDDLQKLTQILFETVSVPGLYVVEQPIADVYAVAAMSGLVVDIGHECTSVSAVLDNMVYPPSITKIPIGGRDIEELLLKLLREDPVFTMTFGGPPDIQVARFIKESGVCDVQIEGLAVKEVLAQLDYKGKKLSIGQARFRCTEVFFNPSLAGKSCPALPETLWQSLRACEVDKHAPLMEAIILCGGGGNFAGLKTRLDVATRLFIAASETVSDLQPQDIKYLRPPEHIAAINKERIADISYLGACITGRAVYISPPSDRIWISRLEYNEYGPMIVHTKSAG